MADKHSTVSGRFPKVADSTHERQQHIVRTTATLIAREGLDGVSVRRIAERAGCSRGLVEHYFGTKAALLRAANEWVNTNYLERVAAAVGNRSGLEALEARLRHLLPYSDAVLDEWRVRLVFWRQAGGIPGTAWANESFYAAYQQILGDIRQAQTDGEIPRTVPAIETSELLLFFVIGLASACIGDERLRHQRPLDRRVEMMIGMLQAGNLAALRAGDPETEY